MGLTLRMERGSVLRILDSKEAEDKKLLQSESCPIIHEYLNPKSKERWEAVLNGT